MAPTRNIIDNAKQAKVVARPSKSPWLAVFPFSGTWALVSDGTFVPEPLGITVIGPTHGTIE
jgi:hypothetical protein